MHRTLCDIYAPIADAILKKIGKEEFLNGRRVSPDKDFNLGRLFLIPKEGNGTIDDTRPISVTNASNRIVAKCLAASILPVLQRLLHKSQKGYLNDRDGGDHIRDTNEEFYGAVQSDGDTENYILFMDYKKAFDSVDHDFLMCMMAKLGLPLWLQRSVWALLQNVHVSPACGGAEDIWIAITRGMKQGCPLSPLLFAICYDPLLRKLDRMDGLAPRAFADDLACSTNLIKHLYPAMSEIDRFEVASGLAKNIKKTKVLCANNHEQAAVDLASIDCPWPDLLTTEEYKYLGILMGARVTLEDVFRAKVNEIWQLTLDSLPALRKLKREERINGFNIFAYPKLVYLMGFFPFPENPGECSVSSIFDRARRVYTTRFYGTAYPKELSLTSHDDFGFKPATKDPWTYSIANLTNQDELHLSNGTSNDDVMDRWKVPESMCITDMARWCGEEFVAQVVIQETHIGSMNKDERPYTFNSEDHLVMEEEEVAPPIISHKKTRGKLYATTLKCAYRVDYEKKLITILQRRNIERETIYPIIQYLHRHQKNNKVLKNYIKNIQADLICNSLVTERRRLPTLECWRGAARETRLASTPPCFLCLGGMDSVDHLYSDECQITNAARNRFFAEVGTDTSSIECPTYEQSLLLFEPISPANTQAISIFNAAIWIERTNFFKILDQPIEYSERVNRLVGKALSIWRARRSSKKSKNKPSESN